MADNIIKCNSCGFPLDAASALQSRIKCPKCGAVNVIETPMSEFVPDNMNDNEDVVGGVPFTASNAAIHKSIVSWILKNQKSAPADVFEELRITGVEKIYSPCYLFECNSTVRFFCQTGNERERARKTDYVDCLEEDAAYPRQNDAYVFSRMVFLSGCSQYSDAVESLYANLDVSKLVDTGSLPLPADVKLPDFDVSLSNAQEEAKTILEKRSQETIVSLLKRSADYGLHIRDDFHVEFSSTKQIRVPLIHVTFAYKDQTGDIWLSGDTKRIILDNFPLNYEYRNTQLDLKKELSSGCSGCGSALLLILLLVGDLLLSIQMAGGIAGIFISNAFLVPLICLVFYLMSRSGKETKRINSELEQMEKDHNEIFSQFLEKQVPLNGVLQKELLGKPEAFPQDGESAPIEKFITDGKI